MASISRVPYGTSRAKRRGYFVIDAEDFAAVSQYAWCVNHYGYVVRREDKDIVFLHRWLLGLRKGDGRKTDHINGNRLDNRRSNIRVCTQALNSQNLTRRRANNTSGFRGVSWHPTAKAWVARVTLSYKNHYLGCFKTPQDAAAAAESFRAEHMPFSSLDARGVIDA